MLARLVAAAFLIFAIAGPSSARPTFVPSRPALPFTRAQVGGSRASAGRDEPAAALRGKIAFLRSYLLNDLPFICVMDAGGSGLTQLTDPSVFLAYAPEWSPDGRRIAFFSCPDWNWETSNVYVMNADGTQQTQLTHDLQWNEEPSWSPDGKRIAFVGSDDGYPQVHVMNSDGSGLTRLTNDAIGAYTPDWSPDGTKILFGADDVAGYYICVINPDGSGRSVVSEALLWDLTWSPDGTQIAGVGYDSQYLEQIYLMSADGSGLRRVTDEPALDGPLAWSPDGKWIAFGSWHGDTGRICAVSPDGSERVELTDGAVCSWSPAWSPLFEISGQVTDAQGAPLAGVSLRLMPGDKWVYNRVDDGSGGLVDGPFCFRDVAPGTYTVSAFKAGYQFAPASRAVTVGPSKAGRSFTGTPRAGDGTKTYRAVLTGVAAYPTDPLQWCVEDMLDVTYGLVSGANWSKKQIVQLADGMATRDRIQSAIAKMGAQVDGDDVCVVSFSGHGNACPESDLLDQPAGLAGILEAHDGPIYSPEFGHWLNQLRTSHYVVILDCCHSGAHVDAAHAGDGGGLFAQGLADALGLAHGEERPADLNHNGCGTVMVGCRATELGAELNALRNGVFTYCLVEGVVGRRADTNGDGWVSATEAYTYARPRTTALAKPVTPQHPVLYQGAATPEPLVGAFDLPDVRVREAGQTAWLEGGTYRRVVEPEPTLELTVPQGGKAVFQFSVKNASGTAQNVSVRARTTGGQGWTTTYYDAYKGGTDITGAITSAAGWPVGSPAPGAIKGFRAEVEATGAPQTVRELDVVAWFAADKQWKIDRLMVSVAPSASTSACRLLGLSAAPTATGAQVTFTMTAQATVTAVVHNLAGRPVRTLCRDLGCRAGANALLWNARSDQGSRVPNGPYVVEVLAKANDGTQARALTPVRISR